jgi:uncharacterized protein (DUF983 family)
MAKTYDNCPHCGQDLRIEIGFYWGALYVAYGLSVFTSLAQFLLYFLVFNLSLTWSFILFIGVQIILSPWLYRLSKAIWINFFVTYRPAGR